MLQNLRKDHFDRWILQLLDQVLIQQALLELIDGVTGLDGQVFEPAPDPDQRRTADVVALNRGLAALAAFQSCCLLPSR